MSSAIRISTLCVQLMKTPVIFRRQEHPELGSMCA